MSIVCIHLVQSALAKHINGYYWNDNIEFDVTSFYAVDKLTLNRDFSAMNFIINKNIIICLCDAMNSDFVVVRISYF